MTPAFLDYNIAAMARYQLVAGHPELGERTGLLTTQRLQEQIDQLVSLNVVAPGLTVDQIATFDFIPPAPQAVAR
jgi:hypothetical protein